MTAKHLRLYLLSMIIAAGGCAEEVVEKPTEVQAQTQALVMAPGWVIGSTWPTETMVALNSVHLRQDSQVVGNVAVIRAGSGPFLSGSFEAVVAKSVELRGNLRADSVSVKDGAHVFGSVTSNSLVNSGTIDGAKVSPLALPLSITVPSIPNFSAGTTDVTVASSATQLRAAGSYRNVVVRAGTRSAPTVLTLSGGVYAFAALDLAEYARVECSAACELRIKGRLAAGDHTYLGPAAASGLQVSAVKLIVEAANGGSTPSSTPLAAELGAHSELKAFVFVPNGTLWMRANSSSVGKFIAKDLDAGNDADVLDGTAVVVLPGQWRSGSRWPSEAITALNSVDFNQGARVTGDAAVIAAAAGAALSPGYEASLGPNSLITGKLSADSVIGRSKSRVTGALAYNNLTNNGVTAGSMVTPLALPLEITTPAFPAFSAGNTVVDMPGRSDRTLAAGSYGLIKLRAGVSSDNTVLTLSGGVYNLADVDLADNARIECSAACELRVKNRVAQAARTYLGPSSASGLDISQVRVFVEGRNAGDGQPLTTPYAAVFGADSKVSAFVFVPSGTLHLRSGVEARGHLAARDVLVADSARVDAAGVVITPPQITQQPSSISVVDGQSAMFSVVAVGTAISFQWQRGGVDILGATAGSYTLDPARMSDNGATFRVVVTNGAGSVTSNAATLTVTPAAPVITAHPASISVLEGDATTFSCAASGTAPSYRWTKDGSNIGGATSATYSIASVTVADQGAYRCVASNGAGSATSNPATLTVRLRAPVITVQPSDITRSEGQSATFSVTATGTDRTYQWRKGGGVLNGETSATLNIASVTLADAGPYDVVVTNSGGAVTSRSATLTVLLVAPQITQHPVSQTVTEGAPVTFTCGASGNLIGYQWLNGTGPIPGATAASYTIIAVGKDHAGPYRCVVTNASGSATSTAALLSVRLLPPQITAQPSALTVTEKQSASFTCAASGTDVSVRWQKGGVDTGSTGETYTIASVAPGDAGDYRCVATNSGGSATSQAAALTVLLLPPVIETGPSSLTVTENQPATFHCSATGYAVTYQWRKGDGVIAGAINATFAIAHAKNSDEGEYRCIATNSGGSATSDPATLNVQALPPQITNQPDARTVDEHAAVSFTCAASGDGVSYAWQKDEGGDIPGANAATYSIADVKDTDAGEYRCVATNESGSATSATARLTVRLLAPQITTQPSALTVTEKQSASFSCAASGTAVSIRWQKNGADTGATGETYTIASVAPDDAGNSRCVATNTGGSATSQAAALTVLLLPPVIESGPSSLTVTENEPATFHCSATGYAVTYTWRKGDGVIGGATGGTYTLAHAKNSDEGEYRCIATNSGGSATSEPATLNVQALPPQITNQPDARTVDEHAPVSFTCAASGDGVSYTWQKGEADIADATSATYSIADVEYTDAGSYRCVATNESGSATSAAAELTVRLRSPQITTHPTALTVTEKQAASFSCAASGTLVSHRWQRNGADIPGAGSQTYTIASVTAEDAGNYRCVATNTGGSATSQAAALGVLLLPPVIESGPSSLTVTENEPATFSCTARGSSIAYRWFKGDAAIGGATSAVFTIAHAKSGDEAEYRCEVTNSGGSATSEPATLNVQALPPQITNQPDSRTVDERDSVSFTCAASGSDVTFHWQKGGADIADSSGATYTIADVKYEDAGDYACVATNESGSATSTSATLTVRLLAPHITAQPQDLIVTEREPATFHCEASGTRVDYRWQKNGQDIPDSEGSTFTIASVAVGDAGNYRCIATNTGGGATSQASTLAVHLLPPRISAGPLSVHVYERQTATFQCLGEGTEISYQWQKDGSDLPGANAAELAIVGVAYTDAGAYRCKVSNSGGEAFSQPATLTVDLLPPSFPAQPASVTLTEGEPFSLYCPAEGTLITFQWLKDGTPIEGAVFATYSVEAAVVAQTGVYTCLAANSGGSTTSQPASVVVQAKPPVITTQPADVQVNENQPITFSVVAQGHALTYQWLRAGAPVPGATQASYTKAQATAADDRAVFRVVVSNGGGSVTSDPATVHVADTSGPALEVSTEAEGTVSGDTFTVTGSASDAGSGLRDVTLVSDRVPGQTFGVVLDTAGAWTGDIPLSLGTNVITVVARDAQNNETRRTITIKVTAPVVPQITVESPSDGSTVQTERVTVSGRVRSTQPASDIKLLLGSATLYPSGSGPDYAFSFEQVRLVPGPNLITVAAQTPRGNTQADVRVTYAAIAPPPSTPVPPVIELQPNLADVYLSTDTIPVTGTVRAQRCVQSIRVNGAEVSFVGTGPVVTFSTTRSFSAAGSTDVLVSVNVKDCDTQNAAVSFTAHRDDGAPVISVDGLQLAPAVNSVSRTPYRLSGSITDRALAGVSIASQSVAAQPTGVPGQWRFAVDLELQRQLALPIVIEAWDAAGARSNSEVVLQLDSNLGLEVLAPNDRAAYVMTDQPVSIEVTARASGMALGDVVTARIDEGNAFELLRAGPVANGVLSAAPVAGEHTISVVVTSAQGSVLAQRSVRVVFTDERDLPVRVVSQEPAADSANVEANTPIVIHFNRAIDPSRLTMTVVETVHGKLFEEQTPGADLTQLSAVNMIDVDRERETVPGVAQNLPGNRMITFLPSRDYGYGGTVFVDLRYNDEDLAHSKFMVRPLPTLVHGFVATQQLIPLQGIDVFLPDLGRTAISNDDGNWNFGFGEPPDRRIAPGRYRAVFNPQRKRERFGSIERFIEITPGLAFGGTVLVPELNKAEPFRHIVSLQPEAASLASGDLQLDLSSASLQFPDGLAEGDVHVQFLGGSQVGHVSVDGARPDWAFGVQPGGVQVQGAVGVRIQVPKLDQSFAYVDKLPEYMLLVGLDSKSLQLAPVGVVHLDRAARKLESVGVVRLERLDYVGVAITAAQPELLRRYANGELDLAALNAAIGAAR